ncbi:MAG: hypothetical protein LC808_03620 [Actinobacteria bacterium]|nr:hypothetical protein [Actinomycetota bacterium]
MSFRAKPGDAVFSLLRETIDYVQDFSVEVAYSDLVVLPGGLPRAGEMGDDRAVAR